MKANQCLKISGVLLWSFMASLNGQESQPEPMVLPGPTDGGKGGQSGSVSLVHESSKANKITDDENWWKVNELKTAASWMIPKGERLYVRCYNTEEVFRVVLRD